MDSLLSVCPAARVILLSSIPWHKESGPLGDQISFSGHIIMTRWTDVQLQVLHA